MAQDRTAVDVTRDLLRLSDADRAAVLSYMRGWCEECGREVSSGDGHSWDDHEHRHCDDFSVEAVRVRDEIREAMRA